MLRGFGSACVNLLWFLCSVTLPAFAAERSERVLELDSETIFVDDFAMPDYHAEYHLHSTIFSPRTVDLVIIHPGQIDYCIKSHTERELRSSPVIGGGGGYVSTPASYTVCDRYGKIDGKIETIIKLELGKGGTSSERDFTLTISQASIHDGLDFDIVTEDAKKKKIIPHSSKQRVNFWHDLKPPRVSFDFGGKDTDLKIEQYLRAPFLESFEQAASPDSAVLVPKESPTLLAKKIVFHRDRRTPTYVEFEIEFFSWGSTCLFLAPTLHNGVTVDTCISHGRQPTAHTLTHALNFSKARTLNDGEEEVFEIIVVGGRKPRVIAGPDYKVKRTWLAKNWTSLVYIKNSK